MGMAIQTATDESGILVLPGGKSRGKTKARGRAPERTDLNLRRRLPRWLPPYLHGLFASAPQLGWQAHEPDLVDHRRPGANPTLVNNAETLAHAAWILANGAEAFRAVGTEASTGTVLCTVVGDVAHPGVFEVPMGTPLPPADEPAMIAWRSSA